MTNYDMDDMRKKNKESEEKCKNPDHYSDFKIEPLQYIIANNLDFLEGNIVKYISRWRFKGGIEDLKKAQKYLNKLIKEESKNEKIYNKNSRKE